HVALKLSGEREPLSQLRAMHATDLYLACACAQGDPNALRVFERCYMPEATAHLLRAREGEAFADEVRQALRERIFVALDGQLPRIGTYSGRGPLAAWVRIAAVRVASNLQRARKGVTTTFVEPLRSPLPDPELDYLRMRHGRELKRAFEATLVALP